MIKTDEHELQQAYNSKSYWNLLLILSPPPLPGTAVPTERNQQQRQFGTNVQKHRYSPCWNNKCDLCSTSPAFSPYFCAQSVGLMFNHRLITFNFSVFLYFSKSNSLQFRQFFTFLFLSDISMPVAWHLCVVIDWNNIFCTSIVATVKRSQYFRAVYR